jgi:restriction system protein
MPVPRFDEIMLPLLNHIRDGREYHMREVIDSLAQHFGLTDKERRALLPSGQPIFENRIGWARTYPKKAGLLQAEARCDPDYRGRKECACKKSPVY